MIGFISRAKRRGTAPLPGSAAAAGAGPVASAGPVAGKVAGKDASVGRNTPAGKDASVGRGACPGNSASIGAGSAGVGSAGTGSAGNSSAGNGFTGRNAPAGKGVPAGADVEPSGRAPGTFIGATLPICGVDVLIVVVHPWVLADIHEANLYVVAFHERFQRRIVLTAQGAEGTPCFYGPTEIIRVLRGLPFEMIPWRRLLFRAAPPPALRLPLPPPRAGSGRTDAEHIGADSAAITHRADRAALTVGARPALTVGVRPANSAGAHGADSADDTIPHRRESRARRADRTTAY